MLFRERIMEVTTMKRMFAKFYDLGGFAREYVIVEAEKRGYRWKRRGTYGLEVIGDESFYDYMAVQASTTVTIDDV